MSFKDAYGKLNIQDDSVLDILHTLQRITINNNILYTFIEQITNYIKLIAENTNTNKSGNEQIKNKILDIIDKTYIILMKLSVRKKHETMNYTLNIYKETKFNKNNKAWKNFSKKAMEYLDKRVYSSTEKEFNLIYDFIDLEFALHNINNDKIENNKLTKTEKTEIIKNVYNFILNFDTMLISSTSESANESLSNSEEWYSANEFSNQTTSNQEYFDTNNTTYCYCNGPYVGRMIGCDGVDCPIEWFHFDCVNLKETPKDKWYCKECLGRR